MWQRQAITQANKQDRRLDITRKTPAEPAMYIAQLSRLAAGLAGVGGQAVEVVVVGVDLVVADGAAMRVVVVSAGITSMHSQTAGL